MTKQELWDAYVAKNPKFADESADITLTARGLKKLFEQTYDHGYEHGKTVGSALAKLKGLSSGPPTSSSDPFGLFRGF